MRRWEDYKKTMNAEANLWQSAKQNDLEKIKALVGLFLLIRSRFKRGRATS